MPQHNPDQHVLVLGASGFIGSAVVARLRVGGVRVTGQSRRTGVTEVTLDLINDARSDVAETIASIHPTVVVNAAGALWPDAEGTVRHADNATLVERLTAAVVESGIAVPRLVHLGSVYEYGSTIDDGPIDERTATSPRSDYAVSKLAATDAAQRWPSPAIVLRCSTVIGAGSPPASLLGRIAAIVRAAPVPITGRPTVDLPMLHGVRDFVDVDDVADAVHAACDADLGGAYSVVNIASGVSRSVSDVVDLLLRTTGADPLVRTLPATRGARDAGVGDQEISIEKARHELAWRPCRSIEASVERLWRHTSDPLPVGGTT